MTKSYQNNLFSRYIREIPRVFVGLILISTGLGKSLDMPGFVDVLNGYQFFPYWLSVILAYSIPFVELAIGIALLKSVKPRQSAWLAVGLHILMLIVVLITLYRGIEVENCGCFGVFFARPLTALTVIEDIVMLVMSLLALWNAKD